MCWSQESIIATRTIAEPAAVGPTTSDRRTERWPRGPVADCVPGQLKRRRREPHPPCSGRAGGNSEIINRRCAECRLDLAAYRSLVDSARFGVDSDAKSLES